MLCGQINLILDYCCGIVLIEIFTNSNFSVKPLDQHKLCQIVFKCPVLFIALNLSFVLLPKVVKFVCICTPIPSFAKSPEWLMAMITIPNNSSCYKQLTAA